MLTYWVVFVFFAWMALSHARPIPAGIKTPPNFQWKLTFIALSLFIGLRYEVGADWFGYISIFENAEQESLLGYLGFTDPMYALLNWTAAHLGANIYIVNIVCAILFTWGLLVFCRQQPRPWLALLVAIPYLLIVVAMGYQRQGVAIGLSMIGLVALERGQIWRFLFWVALASTFHKSSVILVPFAALISSNNRLLTGIVVVIIALLLFLLLIRESLDLMVHTFIYSEYESSGAAFRVSMNAIPALFFLMRSKNFNISSKQINFWTYMSYMSLSFIVFLMISPSTAAVDRVALYCIPLQLFVFSHLPDAIATPRSRNAFWVFAIITYSASVLFIWLLFSNHAFAWIPYQFYPWVWLWQ